MKNKLLIALVIVLIILQTISPVFNNTIMAIEDSNILLISGGVTITKNSTVDDVTRQYGQAAKLITPSAFGGYTYTYSKNNYENVLYLETDENGVIVSYGALSDDFQSSFCSFGEKISNTISYLQGTTAKQNITNGVIGIVTYRSDIIGSKVSSYCKEFMNNKHDYEKYYSEHAVIMLNYYLKKEGCEVLAEFDEELYDTLDKIVETESLNDYAKSNNKEQYLKQAGTDFGYLCMYQELPNPLRAVSSAKNFYPTELNKYAYLKYSMYINSSGDYDGNVDGYYFSERLLEDLKPVSITSQEKALYENSKKEYLDSMKVMNQNGSTVFEQEPNYENVPLISGKIYENKIKGSIGFLNAIRVGAGLGKISYNADITTAAQNKAVLVRYISLKGISTPNAHYPAKPDGVSDEFYNKAQQYMNENLYNGNILTSIINAINDIQGDPIDCGHRYNLLNPKFTEMGIGYANGQSAHKFSGNASYNNEIVAWPSIGVTPVEGFSGGYWTFKIYKNAYSTTDNTTVVVKRLNDNMEWNFTTPSEKGNNKYTRKPTILSFYNADLTGNDGQVYQITVKNLKNNKNNTIEDYTYRTVFKNLGDTSTTVYPTSVNLNKTNITAAVGSKVVLKVEFPEGTTEVRTTWTSSNPSVATVDQFGQVKILKEGTANIQVRTLNGKTKTCVINAQKTITGFETDKEKYIIRLKKTAEVKVREINDMPFDTSKLQWKIEDENIATVENGTIIAKSEGETNLTITYDGIVKTCKVKIVTNFSSAPRFKVRSEISYYSTPLKPGDIVTINVLHDEKMFTGDRFEFGFSYNKDNFEIEEVETLIDNLTYNLEDGDLHFYYNSVDDVFNTSEIILSKIKLKVKDDCTYKENKFTLENIKYHLFDKNYEQDGVCQYITNITTSNAITNIALSETNHKFESLDDSIVLEANITPKENVVDTSITWESSDVSIAKVDKNGKVTPLKNGTAIITATTSNGKKATCVIEVEIKYRKGDMNTDGFINSTDAALVLDRFKNQDATAQDYERGDMNNDNLLNSTDASMILDVFKNTK